MPLLLQFLIKRFLSMLITLLVVTLILYGMVMLTPLEARASLYFPGRMRGDLSEECMQMLMEEIIERHQLRDPYPVQYAHWINSLVHGEWGWSPTLQEAVLPALLARTPATVELTLFSMLLFIPLGIVNGVVAGQAPNAVADHRFRTVAFIATSLPVFILALILLSVFYAGLKWFPPERLSILNGQLVQSSEFTVYTGLWTIDGLLNGRMDISLDALRHLVLPVITLSALHWATLGRITRAVMMVELQKDYVVALRARGIPQEMVIWKHALRNGMAPILTSTALSAASLVTGVFVVEIIFHFNGVSQIITKGLVIAPDAPAVLGFAVYSVIVVLLLMWILDILQALFDQRIREGIL